MNSTRVTVHPGRILLEDFLAPQGLSVRHLAKDMGVPAWRINEIIQGTRSISADIALRLAHYFGLSGRFWLDLQARYDLAREKERLRKYLDPEHLRRTG